MYTILALFIQILGFFLVIQILTGRIFKFREGLLTTFIIAVVAPPLFFYLSYWANLFTVFIFVTALILKKQSKIYSVIITLVTWILSIVSEYLLTFIFVQILKFNYQDLTNKLPIAIIYFLLVMSTAVCLAAIAKKVMIKISFDSFIKQKKYGFIILSIVLFTLLIYYINIYYGSIKGFDRETLQFNTILFSVYFVVLIGILFMVIQTAIKELQMKNQQVQFEQLKEYTTTLESLHKQMRVFRHDYINILSTLAGFMEENDMEGLKEYFEANIAPINQTFESNNHKISLLQNVHITELKGLIAIKLIRAQDLNVDTVVEAVEDIYSINMNSLDLCKSVGILLDNAVEAAIKCENPVIRIAFVKKQDSVLIVFANSIPANMPPIYKIFQEGFSTKGDGRGVGLASLRETIQRYQNVSLDTKITDREFVQELEIM